MTTFTTEDRILAEKDGSFTVNVEGGTVTTGFKELTDEEIIAVGNAVVNHIDSNEGWIEFARAILRKAQEK